jgi:hypothetical protein
MASDVDICNLALSLLGDSAQVTSISGGDTSAQAVWCQKFYPVARDTLLARHPWRFAIAKEQLTATATAYDAWAYAYVAPTDIIRPLNVIPAATQQQETTSVGFNWAADTIYTESATPVLQYIRKVTDATKFPAYFVNCLARLLASYLAGPLIKGQEGVKVGESHTQILAGELERAIVADASFGRTEQTGTADWVFSLALAHIGSVPGAMSLNPLDGSPLAQRCIPWRSTPCYPVIPGPSPPRGRRSHRLAWPEPAGPTAMRFRRTHCGC